MYSNKSKYLILIYLILSSLLVICKTAEDDPITIHVVPHTHDDLGWLWTIDEYYQGTGDAPMSVKRILDNFINSLNDRQDRTFIYVEMAFFTIWYKTQTEETKLQVKKLLKEGRFEFINGGYVMHDEAASYYQHIIDQMRLGLQFLKEEFDYTPEIAWFIDPFGHSTASAYILSKMGFKKIAFVRIDYKEKNIRRATKNLEFYWVPFDEVDSEVKIFTHVTYDHYCPPGGMENFIDDRELSLPYDEVVQRSDTIYDNLKTWNSGYRHKNVLLMYGCDFSHNARDSNYKNVEAVMDYINTNRKDMKLVYSTPSKYFNTVFEQVKDWPNTYKNQDFFPYADDANSYWTGYVTSRPFLKGLVRETGNYLTSSSRFIFDYMLKNKMKSSSVFNGFIDNLFYIRENHAICQHHDAVAGTAKEEVSEDYEFRLNSSIEKSKDSLKSIIKDVASELKDKDLKICISSPVSNIQCQSDLIRNITVSENSENRIRYSFGLLNPQLQGKYPVTLDLSDQYVISLKGIEVRDENSQIIVSDLFCLNDKSSNDNLKCKLRFMYNFDKSKSMTTFSLTFLPTGKDNISGNLIKEEILSEGHINLLNQKNLKIEFDIKNLNFKSEINSKVYTYEILHAYYNSYDGHNSNLRPEGSNPDGAYILSTVEEMPITFKVDYSMSHVYKGSLSTLIQLRFEQSYLFINIFHEPYMIELESIFDPIVDRSVGKNFLLLINSDINNNVNLPDGNTQPEFWTDANGMKMMRRFKDFRQGWKYEITDKVSGNFLPVNAKMSIRERKNYKYSEKDYEGLDPYDRMITVYNDRPQSGGVMTTGHMMFLVHRFSTMDDRRGVGEPIFENSSANTYFRTKHIIVFDNSVDQSYFENFYQNKPAIVSLGEYNKNLSIESDLNKLFELKNVGMDKFHHDNLRNYQNVHKLSQDSNLIVNYHLKSPSEIFVQVYNPSDFYFNSNITDGYITFKNIDGITYTLNEYKFNSVSPVQEESFMNKFLYQSHVKDTSFSIKPQDFKLFLLKFK
jgi:lysosomal alpha-mannosidase